MAKLTKRLLDALVARAVRTGKEVDEMDDALENFGVRMKPSGVASFFVRYRLPGANRQGRHTFARFGVRTIKEARTEARRLLANGGDHSARRREAREALTVAELCEKYLEAARAGLVITRFGRPKRASTVAIDGGRVSRHIVPLLGSNMATKLSRADVQRMADAIAAGKTAGTFKTKARGKAVVEGGAGTAARVVELLGGIWTWAERRELVGGPNPARGVEKRRSMMKDRSLSKSEPEGLGEALTACSERWPMACATIRLCALTGLRREEAVGLLRCEIDLDGSCLRLCDTKTGRSTRAIGKAAAEHLHSIPKLHDEWLFPNRSGDGRADLKKQIAAIFDAAGSKDARSHDLRRTFASVAAELGYSDATIAELLGHARRGVAERHYVRRADAVLIEAATRTAQIIANALDGRAGEVVELRPTARENARCLPESRSGGAI